MTGKWFCIDKSEWKAPVKTIAGSYVLFIYLTDTISIEKPYPAELSSGCYMYCGNAGKGILQRVKRHMRNNHKIWWHIDQLTVEGTVECVFWSQKFTECGFTKKLRDMEFIEPVKGFGSSDCIICYSHLFFDCDSSKEEEISRLMIAFRNDE